MKNNKNRYVHHVNNSIFSFKYFLLMFFSVTVCSARAVIAFLRHMDINPYTDGLHDDFVIAISNILMLSLLFTLLYSLYKRYRYKKPILAIMEAVEKIGKGDFSVRIPLFNRKRRFQSEYDFIAVELNKMAEDLSGVETMRTDFISNVSHEMKTPLSVIQNYAILLQKPDITDEERLLYAKSVTDATRTMTHLITNMLKLNKLENQQIFPELSDFDIGEQLRESLLHFESAWENKEIDLITDIPDDIIIHGDCALLMLVWDNLFSNAFKFTPEHGIVTVSLQKSNDIVKVSISDNGIGIPEKNLSHIFEKFYQVDSSHLTQGNGLGLPLIKRICDIFEYPIQVVSTPGKGTTFTITLHNIH